MNKDFYKNPFSIVWQSRNNLMPLYLTLSWLLLCLISFVGSFHLDFFKIEKFNLENQFSITSVGLTLTLAIFVAGKEAFTVSEMKILAKYKDTDTEEGIALIEFLGPYVFTAIIFFVTGLIALFGTYINISEFPILLLIAKLTYLNILSLGFFSLFNLVVTVINDVYLKANRED